MSPARLRWGMLLILAGSLFLLINFGALDWYVWDDIIALWPLILIAIGIEKIFTNSKAQFIAYIAPIAFAAVVLWVAFDSYNGSYRSSDHRNSYTYELNEDEDISRMDIEFNVKNVDLFLKHASTNLFRGKFNSRKYKADIDYSLEDGIARLEINEERSHTNYYSSSSSSRRSDKWRVYANDGTPLNLVFSGTKSDMSIDCRSLIVEQLSVNSDKGDIDIKLGGLTDSIRVALDGGNADFSLLIPENSGLKISNSSKDILPLFERIGLIESGEFYVTDGYDSLASKIILDLSPDISQLSIEYY